MDRAIHVVQLLDNYETIKQGNVGQLKWDGKPVDISKADYIGRLEREKTSKLISVSDGGIDAFIHAIAGAAKNNVNSWDDTAVAAHGGPGSDGKIYASVIGTYWLQQDLTEAVQDTLKDKAGDSAFLSCYNNPEKVPVIPQTNAYGLKIGDKQCLLDFIPLRITPKNYPDTQPSPPSTQPRP